MGRWPVGLAVWLVSLAAIEIIGFVVTWQLFVRSETGQLVDTVALAGNTIGRTHISDAVDTVLNTISVLSLVIATAVVGFIALIRRRLALAFGAVVLVAGANVTTEILKYLIARPDLGVDPQRLDNSLPSGHTTVVASVAVALVLVLPRQQRGTGAILGACLAALAGVATLSAGWHRPSDAVAALLVVGAWASAAGLFIIGTQRRHGSVEYGPPSQFAILALTAAGIVLLASASVSLIMTRHVMYVSLDEISRRHLLIAYGGGAMGIAGTCALMVASVLATAHRVVPAVLPPVPHHLAETPYAD